MKILEDRYTPRKPFFPRVVYCSMCRSKLEITKHDVRCNKKNDMDICIEITFVCPLCKKTNWTSL